MDPPHLPSGHRSQEIQVVHGHVHSVGVAHGVPKVAWWEERTRVAPATYPGADELSYSTAPHQPLRRPERCVEVVVLADHEDAAGPLRRFHERACAGEGGVEGFLDENMLAGLQRFSDDLMVGPGRRHHEHAIAVCLLQRLVQRRVVGLP